MEVRVPLYLGHSWWKEEPIPLLPLPYPFLIEKGAHLLLGWQREFSSRRMAKPSLEFTLYGDFLHHNRAALTTRLRASLLYLVPWPNILFPATLLWSQYDVKMATVAGTWCHWYRSMADNVCHPPPIFNEITNENSINRNFSFFKQIFFTFNSVLYKD